MGKLYGTITGDLGSADAARAAVARSLMQTWVQTEQGGRVSVYLLADGRFQVTLEAVQPGSGDARAQDGSGGYVTLCQGNVNRQTARASDWLLHREQPQEEAEDERSA